MPPKFIIKTENKLLFDIPQGVIYLDSPYEYEEFDSQHGATCVYTALGHIGLHYGQGYFDREKLKVEEVLWDMATAIGDATLDENTNQKAKDRNIIKACEKAMRKLELTNEDIWSNNQSFQLGFKKTNEARKYKHKTILTEREYWFTLNLASRFNILINGIFNSDIYQQTFATKVSTWNPGVGKNGLFQALSLQGAQVFCGKFGLPYHREGLQLSHEKKLTDEQHVFEFQVGDYDTSINGYHGITVIGMALGESDEETIIYYLDPNISLTPGKENTVFTMSYKDFFERLTDINGLMLDEIDDVSEHRFSWCPNLELQDEMTAKAKQTYMESMTDSGISQETNAGLVQNVLLFMLLSPTVSEEDVYNGTLSNEGKTSQVADAYAKFGLLNTQAEVISKGKDKENGHTLTLK